MPGFSPILFDLDGTLADTYPGIVTAADFALDSVGLPRVPAQTVYPLTGKGVPALIDGLLAAVKAPADPALREKVLRIYSETYERTCADGAFTYPGVLELVKKLKAPLALLTNKPRRYTEKIARQLGFGDAFATIVAGDDPGMKLKPDPWAIHEALRRLNATGGKPALVGDTKSDVLAAEAARIPCCVVKWGHGGADVLKIAKVTVSDVAGLERWLTE